MTEINEAAQLVSTSAAVDANIIFGAVIDDALGDEVRVTVIAAGLDQERTGRVAASGADAGSSSFGASASAAPAPVPSAPPAPRAAPSAPPFRPVTPEAGGDRTGGGPSAVTYSGNGSSPAVPDTSFAPVAGSILGAPVPDDGITASSDPAAEASPAPAGATADEMPEPEPARPADPERSERPERAAMAADVADSSYRAAHTEMAAKTFDVATTRRRPVVFEEDDDLDVPDFLK